MKPFPVAARVLTNMLECGRGEAGRPTGRPALANQLMIGVLRLEV
jgi:hypothetical protein